MEKGYIDFHLHSTNSDGERTVEEYILDAAREHMQAIAITDHNCFALRERKISQGVEVIPGCEFSTTYNAFGQKKEIHVVGLFYNGVEDSLNTIFDDRNRDAYAKAIIHKMNEVGLPMTFEELQASPHLGRHLGRMQIAVLMVQKGYAKDVDDALDHWIGNSSPYYLNPSEYVTYIGMKDCVKKISEAYGLPILAHPYHYGYTEAQIEAFVADFRSVTDQPLGLEVYYKKYSPSQMEYLRKLAEKYRLLPSASSDAHKRTHAFMKGDYSLYLRMKNAMGWR